MEGEDLPLGAWEAERGDLKNVALGDRGDVAGLPDFWRFRVHVVRMILARERNAQAEYDHAAAFVMVEPSKYQELKASGGYEEIRLIHTGGRRLTGRVHVMTAGATSSLVREAVGDLQLFGELEDQGLKAQPTFLYVPQRPLSTLSCYMKGCTVDECSDVPLRVADVSADRVRNTIDAVYAQELVTPDGMGPLKIWKDASGWRPSSLAEKSIQQLIRIGLVGQFSPCSIRQEQSGKVGRTDIEIVEIKHDVSSESIHHALLELKVLRSFTEGGGVVSDKATSEHIDDGVKQAKAYGADKGSRLQLLCCFDMRKDDVGDDKTFAHVAELAKDFGVITARWFLYASSELYRDAEAARRK